MRDEMQGLRRARVGTSDRQTVLWLDDHSEADNGLDRIPQEGDTFKIEGE